MHCPVRVRCCDVGTGAVRTVSRAVNWPIQIRLPPLEPPAEDLARRLQPTGEHRRVVLARRADLPVPEPALHVADVDPALPELERHTMPRLIRAHIRRPAGRIECLRGLAAIEVAPGTRAMKDSHAATMSSLSQNARGSPPFAVRTIHTRRSRSTSVGSARFNSAGRTPVEAITWNRARVFASVRFAATVRNTTAGTRIFGETGTDSGFTPSTGVGARSPSST